MGRKSRTGDCAAARPDVFRNRPGRGAITGMLAAAARRVVAFEIDRDLAASLRRERLTNVHVIEGDFLSVGPGDLRETIGADDPAPIAIRVAGNLPYNVASPILFKLVELYTEGIPFADATVMLQREVAIRLTASPGNKDYGVLTILIGRHASIEPALQLPAGAFRPIPKIQSTLVRLRFHAASPPVQDERVFEAVTQAIFTRRRKTLANALLAYPLNAVQSPAKVLSLAGLDPQRRPETLTLQELARLSDSLGTHANRSGF
ncbi:MAG TPA: 16S rRNA (adenine(1518)-N(6)/adenine(1519)-N(6))-dimethyltransferase RsmA [Vicinamibacterales bacterium]